MTLRFACTCLCVVALSGAILHSHVRAKHRTASPLSSNSERPSYTPFP